MKKYLVLILALAFVIRTLYLGSVPQGFNPDEASQGYTAYSILKTGHDEWGLTPSLTGFKSFLDYKAPLQTYLMIPSIAIFGLNEFAVRLPSAIFGTLAILAIYLLATEVFQNKKAGLFAALVLAISPWHIQFSRTALEANLISFFFPFGLFCFLRGLKNPKFFILTSLSWGLALYSYHAAKLFIPLFLVSTGLIYFSELTKTKRKYLIGAFVVLVVLVLPLTVDIVWGNSAKRGADLLITNLNADQIKDIALTRYYSPLNRVSPILPRLFHNKFTFNLDKFVENYISYYTFSFWFTEGGRETTYSVIPGRGLLLVWQLPFILVGLYWLIRTKKISKKQKSLIISWILLAAIPAAVTSEGYRPNRASVFLGLWEMLTGAGLFVFFKHFVKHRRIFATALAIVVFVTFASYLDDYVFASRVHFPTTLDYGWRDTMYFVNSVSNQYQNIYVERGGESQMMVAFYAPIQPEDNQKAAANWNTLIINDPTIKYLDQLPIYSLGKYTFKYLSWDGNFDKSGLYISSASDRLPQNRHTLFTAKSVSGTPILEVFDFYSRDKYALLQK